MTNQFETALPLMPALAKRPATDQKPMSVPAMPLLIGGFPKPPMEGDGAEAGTVLRFPDDQVGTLLLSKKGEAVDVRAAAGEVLVPAGWLVQLNLPDEVSDGAVLAGVPVNGVQVLIAPGLDDEALDAIAGYRVLTYLRLGERVTDAGIRKLCGLTSLTMLSVSSEHVTDASMESLLSLTELQSVHFSPCALTDAGLATLARLPSLTSLSITAPALTDAVAAALASCPSLTDLTLDSPGLGNATINTLGTSATLKSLSLTGSFDDAGLLELAHGYPALQSASMTSEAATDDGITAVFLAGISAQLNGQWLSPKAVERLRRKAAGV